MVIESKNVPCECCKGNMVTYVPSLTPTGDMEAESVTCPGCDGTGIMEIRKLPNADWSSKCHNCEGKGFNDAWDHQHEEHTTDECNECNGTGGILYLKPVA